MALFAHAHDGVHIQPVSVLGLETERARFAQYDVMVAAQGDMLGSHQPFIGAVVFVFAQHHRRVQAAYFVLQGAVAHQFAAQIKHIGLGQKRRLDLAHIAYAHQHRFAHRVMLLQSRLHGTHLLFFIAAAAACIRAVGQVKRVGKKGICRCRTLGQRGDIEHFFRTESHAAHGDYAVLRLRFAADDAPGIEHAYGALHFGQALDFVRMKHPLVAHRANNGALLALRNMLLQAAAAYQLNHPRHRLARCLLLHYDNHVGSR